MVFAVKPVNLLVKRPVPEPSVVLLFAVVGFCDVLQHIPLTVTVAPPSLVIFPPLLALMVVMEEAGVVVIVGITALTEFVVKLIVLLPKAVPALFVAYART